MRAVSEKSWERTLTRYLNAHSIPLQWHYSTRRFSGVKGFNIARINPELEEGAWASMPKRLRSYESRDRNPSGEPVILFVTNRRYGDSVDDSMVVMRLGAFIPMLKAFVDMKLRERNGQCCHQ